MAVLTNKITFYLDILLDIAEPWDYFSFETSINVHHNTCWSYASIVLLSSFFVQS